MRMNSSKSTLRSSTSTIYKSDEKYSLKKIIEALECNNKTLKISLESKDKAIEILAQKKEKLSEELKCAQRTNRNLYQQLKDEREIHLKEKEYLIENIQSNKYDGNLILVDHGHRFFSSLGQKPQEKDEIIYNICNKYLKIKCNKSELQRKLAVMQKQNQEICETIILILQENKRTLHRLFNTLLNMSYVTRSNKKFIKLLKINSRLYFENTLLKIRLSCGNEKSTLHRTFCSNTDNFFNRSEALINFSTYRALTPKHYLKEVFRSKSDTNLF